MKKTLAITPGDPKGIGPEVTKKALFLLEEELKNVHLVIFSKKFSCPKSLKIEFQPPVTTKKQKTGIGLAITHAHDFVIQDTLNRALVTGPISKALLQSEGYPFVGHTDFLAHLCKVDFVTMVLANQHFRVALTTNHCPLSSVSKNLNTQTITNTIWNAVKFCKNQLKKKTIRIAVLGLNPHAGEGGILGKEEIDKIVPAMKKVETMARKNGVSLKMTGPHPADSFFAVEMGEKNSKKRHDFIIAHYHDQGLIPVKLSDFKNALNMTLGLPYIRTSVDHGTAYDIAGKNKADPSSMVYSIRKALEYL